MRRWFHSGDGWIFGQCIGSVPIHHHEEFGYQVIYSDNPSLQSQLRVSTCWLHVSPKLTGWLSTTVCGQVDMRMSVGRLCLSMACRALNCTESFDIAKEDCINNFPEYYRLDVCKETNGLRHEYKIKENCSTLEFWTSKGWPNVNSTSN